MATIVDIAVQNSSFSTLVTAVQAADLVEVLQSPGPFTVFAPTDDAFAKLPPATIQTLVGNIPQLARILKFHVVAGAFKTQDLASKTSIPSVEGTSIDLKHYADHWEVNNATVIQADIEADNGIIHVIDTVILMRPHWFPGLLQRYTQTVSSQIGIDRSS